MKRRLFPPCRVASPCRIPHTAAGLRLAWQKNPSVSFVPLFPVRDTRQSATLRVFFALWPDGALQTALHHLASGLHQHCGGRIMRPEGLHLTLAFLGALPVNRLEQLYAVAAQVNSEAFDWRIDQIAYWRPNQIVWVRSGQPPAAFFALVSRLHTALSDAGLNFDDTRPFAPHITLLRKALREPPPLTLPPLPWQVREFVLVQSEATAAGSYRVLQRWQLR